MVLFRVTYSEVTYRERFVEADDELTAGNIVLREMDDGVHHHMEDFEILDWEIEPAETGWKVPVRCVDCS